MLIFFNLLFPIDAHDGYNCEVEDDHGHHDDTKEHPDGVCLVLVEESQGHKGMDETSTNSDPGHGGTVKVTDTREGFDGINCSCRSFILY